MADVAIFDLDGTLVDSTYHHALAWYRAFRGQDLTPPLWRIHRAIGMGGDRLVAAVCGQEVEDRYGDDVRSAWESRFDELIDEVSVLDGARELVAAVHQRGLKVVIASSGKPAHVEHYLGLLDIDDLLAASTDAEDADASKPAPDLLQVALDRVGGGRGVCIGDATWDFEAARTLNMPGLGVLTGGFSERELLDAGAGQVFHSLPELTAGLDRTPLAGR
ncbi:MAG: HAD family hydrolase [Geodermatophilaceae bacterium]|nr:HAD family hydrolase [Geodermatophilaceae bacterium]MDQ3455032.1 HAD family hydrolase [Actinomycetota bacterium]